jgi:hypothetical protein
MFWQNDGRHRSETWDYAPKEDEQNYPPENYPTESRVERLRRERQQAMGIWRNPNPPPQVACRLAVTPDGTWIKCTR